MTFLCKFWDKKMLRRHLLQLGLGVSSFMIVPKFSLASQEDGYRNFIEDVTQQAISQGIPKYVTDISFSHLNAPNQKILAANAKQAEFTLSWQQYKQRTVTQNKIDNGFNAASNLADILKSVERIYKVDPNIIVAIWGMESSYGSFMGEHPVIDTLATLAYGGRRRSYFRSELLYALHIIYEMAILPYDLLGSYAGAMGQPQFMPKSYLQFSAKYPPKNDYSDIWYNEGDVVASIANFLHSYDWKYNESWGEEVQLPSAYFSVKKFQDMFPNAAQLHSTSWWQQQGLKPVHGFEFQKEFGTILQPDGAGGEAFMVYDNFQVIKRYNASDSYALSVCLLRDTIRRAIKSAV